MEPLILEIKGNSLDDGPGIRTVVFMKGCPLSCVWCHNPESRKPGPEIGYDKNKCIGCHVCLEACTAGAISPDSRFFVDREKCTLCFECIGLCPSTALESIGHVMSVNEITEKVLRNKPFFDTSGGGVTLSGGEPSMNIGFASELLQNFKKYNLHVLIETCGHFNYEKFLSDIIPFIDIIYYDLKIFDKDDHKKFCGKSNSVILENFTKLAVIQHESPWKIIPRIPLVPGITATEKNLNELAEFLHDKSKQVTLLQYNPLWLDKNMKLGIDFEIYPGIRLDEWIKPEMMKSCESVFTEKGIEVIHK